MGGRPLPVSTVGAAADAGEAAPAARRPAAGAALRSRKPPRGMRDGRGAPRSRPRDHPGSSSAGHGARAPRAARPGARGHPRGGSRGHRLAPGRRRRRDARRALRRARRRAGHRQAGVRAGGAPLSEDARRDAADVTRRIRLARRVAEASEWAGYAEKAARAYLFAAERAPALERLDLERAAATQLIAAGRIEESGVVGRRILTAVGRSVPSSAFLTSPGSRRIEPRPRSSPARSRAPPGSSRPRSACGSRSSTPWAAASGSSTRSRRCT